MGYFRHYAVLVTSWDEGDINNVIAIADRNLIDYSVGISVDSGLQTFTTLPSGIKSNSVEGMDWEARLFAFIQDLTEITDPLTLQWVAVEYGGDGDQPEVIASSYKG